MSSRNEAQYTLHILVGVLQQLLAGSDELTMDIPVNTFKLALREGRLQIGLWLGVANATCAKI
jgi:hypothetical protein